MSRRCTSLAGNPSSGHRSIKILRFCGHPILGPCKGGVLRPVRHAQRIAPLKAKRHILADRWHLGIIRAKPLKSIIILGAPVCKAFQRPGGLAAIVGDGCALCVGLAGCYRLPARYSGCNTQRCNSGSCKGCFCTACTRGQTCRYMAL